MTGRHVYKVAVVGAGPAGLYTAEELVRSSDPEVEVDLIEALPCPYGLVRYGVAPDHPRIKNVVTVLRDILEHPRVSFLGGVRVGETVSAVELRRHYDAVVYSVGAPRDRRMGIDGENLPGSVSASSMVAWYNGFPAAAQPADLAVDRAVVVGGGNVALDIARMLMKQADALRETDMPEEVLAALAAKRITDVTVLVRRGPRDCRFSPKELRELAGLDDITVRVIGVDDAELAPREDDDRTVRANVKLLASWVSGADEITGRTITVQFNTRPVEVLGNERGMVGVRVERTRRVDTGLVPDGDPWTIDAGLLVRSIGHVSTPLDDLPHDDDRGVIANENGRLAFRGGDDAPEYVAGWCKRGPSGVVGTNKLDAAETVALVLDDLAALSTPHSGRTGIGDVLRARGHRWVEVDGWNAIDAEEQRRGARLGRPRVKITSVPDMLDVALAGRVREAM